MEFLKEILGEELFNQFSEKVNAWNGNEANKEKLVKLANLSTGEYVSKLKFDDISQQLTGKQSELDTANGLIAELKKGTKGNEELQGKITTYETQVADLQAELAETKLKSAIKVALLSEKAVDVGYLTFKLNEKLKEKNEYLQKEVEDAKAVRERALCEVQELITKNKRLVEEHGRQNGTIQALNVALDVITDRYSNLRKRLCRTGKGGE